MGVCVNILGSGWFSNVRLVRIIYHNLSPRNKVRIYVYLTY